MQISFEKKKDYIYFKITGEYDNSVDFEKIKTLTDIPKQHDYSTILIDIRDFHYNLNAADKYNLSEYWVKICRNLDFLATAILGSGEKMDDFSENVITNRGGNYKLFTDEKQAVDWLMKYKRWLIHKHYKKYNPKLEKINNLIFLM